MTFNKLNQKKSTYPLLYEGNLLLLRNEIEDNETFFKLLEVFIQDCRSRTVAYKKYQTEQQCNNFWFLKECHLLISGARVYGAKRLYFVCQEISEECRKQDPINSAFINQLITVIDDTASCFQHYYTEQKNLTVESL